MIEQVLKLQQKIEQLERALDKERQRTLNVDKWRLMYRERWLFTEQALSAAITDMLQAKSELQRQRYYFKIDQGKWCEFHLQRVEDGVYHFLAGDGLPWHCSQITIDNLMARGDLLILPLVR